VQHGVQNNTHVLDAEFLTLAERLRDSGYRTAAFVSADAPLGGNIGQGFEKWDQPQPGDRQGPAGKLYRPAGETIDRAVRWIQEAVTSEDKLFLWVHLYDPHKPMNPPPEYHETIAAQIEASGREQHVQFLQQRDIPARDPEIYGAVVDYDSEILYADSELARLYRAMEAFGINRQGLWLLTSDHGQGLGAHGWFGHSVQVYNAQLHVPLVFWFTGGRVPARRIDDRVVELVDLAPTVLELLGEESFAQIMPLRGESLVPSLRGIKPQHPKRFAYAERSRYVDPNPNRLKKGNYESGSRYAYQDLDYKYLLFTEGPDELYDLAADPYELDNLVDDPTHAADAEQMRDLLTAMLAEATSNRPVQSVSEDEIERLKALGYIQ